MTTKTCQGQGGGVRGGLQGSALSGIRITLLGLLLQREGERNEVSSPGPDHTSHSPTYSKVDILKPTSLSHNL